MREPYSDLTVLRRELERYNPELLERPSLILLNKCDTDESKAHLQDFYENYKGQREAPGPFFKASLDPASEPLTS